MCYDLEYLWNVGKISHLKLKSLPLIGIIAKKKKKKKTGVPQKEMLLFYMQWVSQTAKSEETVLIRLPSFQTPVTGLGTLEHFYFRPVT